MKQANNQKKHFIKGMHFNINLRRAIKINKQRKS